MSALMSCCRLWTRHCACCSYFLHFVFFYSEWRWTTQSHIVLNLEMFMFRWQQQQEGRWQKLSWCVAALHDLTAVADNTWVALGWCGLRASIPLRAEELQRCLVDSSKWTQKRFRFHSFSPKVRHRCCWIGPFALEELKTGNERKCWTLKAFGLRVEHISLSTKPVFLLGFCA